MPIIIKIIKKWLIFAPILIGQYWRIKEISSFLFPFWQAENWKNEGAKPIRLAKRNRQPVRHDRKRLFAFFLVYAAVLTVKRRRQQQTLIAIQKNSYEKSLKA